MITKWIARWFGGEPVRDSSPPAATPAGAPAPDRTLVTEPAPQDLDCVFYRWLVAAGEPQAAHSSEKAVLDELARLVATPAAGADLVPRVPAVIPQLLRSLRDESVSGADLARQLAQDVVLVAEVIREANSPYYHPSSPVRTIEGAIMLLGQNGMRMLLARVAFRPIISVQMGQLARVVAPQVWSQSEKCALAASLLAPRMGANPFEAYLAALMQNVGLIVAFRLLDKMTTRESPPQSDAFCARLFEQSRLLSGQIALLWEFPATVASAIGEAGTPGAPALAQALALSDRVSKLRMLVDAGQLAADDPIVLQGLDQASLAAFEKIKGEDN